MNCKKRFFTEKYFRCKQFEQDLKIYEHIGIRTYKKMIMNLTMGKKVDNYNLMNYSVEGLKAFEKKSRYNEKVHFLLFFPMVITTLIMCFFVKDITGILTILLSLVVNIYVNIYPICLQRYNRIRINKILNKFQLT